MSNVFSRLCFFCALIISVPLHASEVKEVKPTTGLCKKATGFSKGLSASIATRKKISTRTIYLLGASSTRDQKGCFISIDTPKGPDYCSYTKLYTDGKGSYWVGGFCY